MRAPMETLTREVVLSICDNLTSDVAAEFQETFLRLLQEHFEHYRIFGRFPGDPCAHPSDHASDCECATLLSSDSR
jgi:hypothetical protein